MDAADGVGEKLGHRKHHYLRILLAVRYGVCKYYLRQARGNGALRRGIAHHGMAAESPDGVGSKREKKVGCLCKRAARVDDIVDEHHILTLHIAYYGHLLHDIGLCTLLVAEHQRHVKIFCI